MLQAKHPGQIPTTAEICEAIDRMPAQLDAFGRRRRNRYPEWRVRSAALFRDEA
jgi:hypothetical protein